MRFYRENWNSLLFSPHVWWILALTLLMLGCGVGRTPKRLGLNGNTADKMPPINEPNLPNTGGGGGGDGARGAMLNFGVPGSAAPSQDVWLNMAVTDTAPGTAVRYQAEVLDENGDPASSSQYTMEENGPGVFKIRFPKVGSWQVRGRAIISTGVNQTNTLSTLSTIDIQDNETRFDFFTTINPTAHESFVGRILAFDPQGLPVNRNLSVTNIASDKPGAVFTPILLQSGAFDITLPEGIHSISYTVTNNTTGQVSSGTKQIFVNSPLFIIPNLPYQAKAATSFIVSAAILGGNSSLGKELYSITASNGETITATPIETVNPQNWRVTVPSDGSTQDRTITLVLKARDEAAKTGGAAQCAEGQYDSRVCPHYAVREADIVILSPASSFLGFNMDYFISRRNLLGVVTGTNESRSGELVYLTASWANVTEPVSYSITTPAGFPFVVTNSPGCQPALGISSTRSIRLCMIPQVVGIYPFKISIDVGNDHDEITAPLLVTDRLRVNTPIVDEARVFPKTIETFSKTIQDQPHTPKNPNTHDEISGSVSMKLTAINPIGLLRAVVTDFPASAGRITTNGLNPVFTLFRGGTYTANVQMMDDYSRADAPDENATPPVPPISVTSNHVYEFKGGPSSLKQLTSNQRWEIEVTNFHPTEDASIEYSVNHEPNTSSVTIPKGQTVVIPPIEEQQRFLRFNKKVVSGHDGDEKMFVGRIEIPAAVAGTNGLRAKIRVVEGQTKGTKVIQTYNLNKGQGL